MEDGVGPIKSVGKVGKRTMAVGPTGPAGPPGAAGVDGTNGTDGLQPFQQNTTGALSLAENNLTLPAGCTSLRLSSILATLISGIAAPPGANKGGYRLTLMNASGLTIGLLPESGLSTAANRFTGFALTFNILSGACVMVEYDGTTQRWRVV